MQGIKLRDIDINEFKEKIYSYYLKIFPEDERKSLKLIETSYKKQYTRIIKILYKDEIVGFMLLNKIKYKGYIGLDYFAILPQYRNDKIGTRALEILFEEEKDSKGIFIEIEKIGLGKDEKENLLMKFSLIRVHIQYINQKL